MAVSNVQTILDYLKEKYVFRYNTGNQKIEFHPIERNNFKDLNDRYFNSIKLQLGLENIQCSKDNLQTIIHSCLWDEYDPFMDYLNNLPEWDGHDYIADMAATIHTDDDDYWQWCFKKWNVAFVACIAVDNIVNQTAPILCGLQGGGKSTWFLNLLPQEWNNYFFSGYLEPKEKDTLIKLSQLCLFCMDEGENMKKRNVEAIKEIITKPRIVVRPAYHRYTENYPRRCSFCGTTNNTEILYDTTGNRRFLCQNVLSIDLEKQKNINLNQLYAQAYQLFRTGFQYWFGSDEQAIVEQHNVKFRAVSVEEELILTYFEPCNDGDEGAKRMQAHEILAYLQMKVPGTKLTQEKVGKILSSKGFDKKKSNVSKWIVRERKNTED